MAAATASLRLDILKRVVNVQWGGLAVIFGPGDTDAKKQDAAAVAKTEEAVVELSGIE
jgi:hypothetical protein